MKNNIEQFGYTVAIVALAAGAFIQGYWFIVQLLAD
jgi:hypothetical protein